MPKVTVAIPTYNRKDYLPEVLKSVRAQTFKDFEVLVFDDHSNYDVAALLEDFKDLPIKLIKSEKPLGNVGNFGRIVSHNYTTPYLVVFHDDDVMNPKLLEREVAVMDANPNLVFMGTDLIFISNHSQMFNFPQIGGEINLTIFQTPQDLLREFLKGFRYCFGSTMYRTNKLEFSAEFSQPLYTWHDRPYLLNLAKKGPAAILREPLVNYRLHAAQVSQEKINLEHLKSIIKMLEVFKSFLPQPLSNADAKLFYGNSTYAILSFYLLRKASLREIKQQFSHPLVKLSALTLVQWLRLLKMLAKYFV